jgi:hypothetical protein
MRCTERCGHEVAEKCREAAQPDLRVLVIEQGLDLRALEHGRGFVVAGYRDVQDSLEDAEFRREQPVHRRLRGVRGVGDRFDGRSCVAPLNEESAGRLNDCGAGSAGACLARGRLLFASALDDIPIHRCESITIIMTVMLSIWRERPIARERIDEDDDVRGARWSV